MPARSVTKQEMPVAKGKRLLDLLLGELYARPVAKEI